MSVSTTLKNLTELCIQYGDNELAAIKFMQSRGIMHRRRVCPRCGRPMVLQHRKDRNDVRWRCHRKLCQKELSPKTGTWLQGCDYPVRTLLLFVRAWSETLTTLKFCRVMFSMNDGAAVRLNAAMRRVAEEWLLNNPVPVGGPGLTVEVDESLFARRKYNRGRMLPQAWVVGGVCRETGHCFLARVADRSAATLINVIKENVAAGSTVITDEWRGYYRLSSEHYTHLRVNHSINFVDRVTGAHTQTVESLWSHAKQGNKARRGTHRSQIDSYLCEFVWRRRLSRDEHPFNQILCAIAELHPPR
uniref:DDE_Tnp_IS1595 domain-containing protein n=1 Tax=Trichuris muris TaxID=70415 RepID=A0A5S6Q3C2_TRIMR